MCKKAIYSLFSLMLFLTLMLSGGISPALARDQGGTPTRALFLQQLRAELVGQLQTTRVAGAVVYVNSARTGTWTTTIGTRDLSTGAPMTTDLHFRIGSITKTLTATVILQLVDEGKLGLDDPVSKFNLGVPNGEHITLRQLLNMSSGLFNYTEDDTFSNILNGELEGVNADKQWTPAEQLALAFKHPPYFAPGSDFYYSNTNYILLGLIIEQITGKSPKMEIERRILNPLGMTHTVIPDISYSGMPAPYAHGYTFLTAQPGQTVPDSVAPRQVTFVNPSWAGTAGDAISTLDDLKIWVKALATGTLLSEKVQRERLQYVTIKTLGDFVLKYGLGIADFDGFLGHNGGLPGFQSFATYNPALDATIIVLTNLNPAADNSSPADALGKLTIEKLLG